MAFKVAIIFAFFGLVAAVPVIHHVLENHHEEHEHHAPAEYKFSYSVHDEHTGDIKSQEEERHGDKVRGSYSLIEPDGHKRTVHYTSDKHTGFQAEVHREGTSHHVPVAHHEAPAVHHVHVVKPLHVATHHVAHAAPVHHEAPSHGHVATSHASIQITHHEDHHGDYHHGDYHHH